jgi:PelA/Pel-15E family pectate lyase
MALPTPEPRVVNAIDSAIAWFRKRAIHGQTYAHGPEGGHLVPAPNAPLLWARFYQIGSNHPIFGDRDKSIHDSIEEISLERRRGYRWYGPQPQAALDAYDKWSARGAEQKR